MKSPSKINENGINHIQNSSTSKNVDKLESTVQSKIPSQSKFPNEMNTDSFDDDTLTVEQGTTSNNQTNEVFERLVKQLHAVALEYIEVSIFDTKFEIHTIVIYVNHSHHCFLYSKYSKKN